MPRPLTLIQITDLHLLADADARLYGWHVDAAWRQVLAAALTRYPAPDALALTGDLVHDESTAGYARLNAQIECVMCPVYAIAGNHDDPAAMRRYLTRAEVHAQSRLGGWQLHGLDSHVDGADAGRLGAAQIERLRARLDVDSSPAAIFVHHPPLSIGSAWIDRIGLADGDALRALLSRYPQVRAVICGHAHQAFEASIGHAACWVTPAAMRQFLPGADEYAVDTQRAPGYRVIELHPDSRATSRIHRVQPACG